MKTCKYCKSEIDDKAKICPNCRKKQSSKGKFIAIVIVAIIIIAALGSSGDDEGNNSASNSASNLPTGTPKPVLKVTANELYKAYDSNEVKADNTYKGKDLEIAGTISDIGKDILDDIYITIETDDIIFSIQCYFTEEYESKVADLEKGQKITIQGVCDGKLGNVLIKDCIIK